MAAFKIVAHRGVTDRALENTIQAFEEAIELGADAVELDVRLTEDHVPVVYHYFYLGELTNLPGPIFHYSCEQLGDARFTRGVGEDLGRYKIPTLQEVLELIGGRIGLEIEIKGPEQEAPEIVGELLHDYRQLWDTLEITSFEPSLLAAVQDQCPAITADLLLPRSEPWMGPDVVAYMAIHKARIARARAVHLHPTQLSSAVVGEIRRAGFEVHAWDVNDEPSLELATQYQLPVVCTDRLEMALAYRAFVSS